MWPFHTKQTSPEADTPPLPTYGHYRVLPQADGQPSLLGYGAMGLTYKAEDTNLRVPVALKVISPLIADQPGAREFFLAEARGAASLRHRNVAGVHHLGVSRTGELFFAMDFVEGETVEAVVARQGPLPVLTALDFAQQAACALAAAARRGLVHRDLKPANLMLSDEGDGAVVVKVIDFGLCKSLAPAAGPAARRAGKEAEGQFLGTPHYASPEQIRGDPGLDQRADFYSLGATLWKMLSGGPVFDGPMSQVRQRHLEEPPPFARLPADVSPPVRALLADLLHKDPTGRPPGALQLIDRIEGAAYDHRGAAADPRRHWKEQGCLPLLGSVLAHNYHLEAVVADERGASGLPMFRAEDIAGGRHVTVRLLERDKPIDAVRASVERMAAAPHPNLIQNHAVSSCRGQPFVVKEWLHGFSLAEAVRARGGGLTLAETRALLGQVAAAVDHARTHDLGLLATDAGAVQVHFGAGEPVDGLPAQRVGAWPEFTLKLRPRGAEFGGGAQAREDEAVRGLGQLAAELLGGPEGALPPEVRGVLDRAAVSPGGFGGGEGFIAALSGAAARETAAVG